MNANNYDIEGSILLKLAIWILYHISLSSTLMDSVHHHHHLNPMRNDTWYKVTMMPKIWTPTMQTFYDLDPLAIQHRFRWVSCDGAVVLSIWIAWKIFAQNWNLYQQYMAILWLWSRLRSMILNAMYSKYKRTIALNIDQCFLQQSVQNCKRPTQTTTIWFYRWTWGKSTNFSNYKHTKH